MISEGDIKVKKLRATLLCFSLLLAGCQSTTNQNITAPEEYAIGVICTTSSKDSSDILYFDTNLEQVGSTHHKYASMGQLFYPSVVYDGSLYVVPQGQARKKDAKTILQQNLTTFEQREYFIDQIALYGISADSSAIYAANNLNRQSFVSRIDRKDNTVKTSVFDDTYISAVYSYKGILYAFSGQNQNNKKTSKIYCLNPETLEKVSEIDTSDLGSPVYSVTGIEDTLYFIPTETLSGEFNHIVGTYHIPTGKLDVVDFGKITHHILNIGDTLYATHGNLVTGEGSELSIYELNSGEMSTYDLGMWPGQIAAYDNSLYVMGHEQIGKYDLKTLEKQAEVTISLEKGYYLSEIFPYSQGENGGTNT